MTNLYPYPNNLYIEWVKELKKEAVKDNSKLQYTYSKALKSLKLYPLPLKSGKETIIIKGIGKGLSDFLDDRLNQCLTTATDLSIKANAKKLVKLRAKKVKGNVLLKSNKDHISKEILNECLSHKSISPLVTESTFDALYEIILYIDSSENNKKFKKQAICHLNKGNIRHEIKKLAIGDFLWVAQNKHYANKAPLVLPYIIERKKAEDLSHSIKDGRYREQKYRLNKYAFVKPIYLVEGLDSIYYRGLPIDTLKQAVINTMIIDDFHIIYTDNLRHSVDNLISFHRYVSSLISKMNLSECISPDEINHRKSVLLPGINIPLLNFSVFNTLTSKNKNLTIKDIFAKQLLIFNGISMEKAYGILNTYPTYFHLYTKLKNCFNQEEKDKIVSQILNDKSKKLLSTKISQQLSLYYN